MEAERLFRSIEQWYERANNLDCHQKKNKKNEERLRKKEKEENTQE